MTMFLRKFSVYLVFFLIITTATAVRKIKRPVKPAKTYPRTNASPSPSHQTPLALANVQQQQQQTQQATGLIGSPIGSYAVQQQQQQQQQMQPQQQQQQQSQQNVSVEEGHVAGNSANDNELPKPMESSGNAGDSIAAVAAIEAKTDKSTTEHAANGMIEEEECDPDMIGFEIITGYVLSAPSQMMDTLPGTLMLTDCLEACQVNESCSAVNYETGLCVLFKTTADKTPGSLSRSQFPVFTIYAQKSCLGVRPCSKAWCIDRVQGYRLVDHVKSSQTVYSRRDCLELCLGETEFICRSANFYYDSGLCELSEMDRITLSDSSNVVSYEGADYLENNCAEEPSKLCEFKRISGRILKTVDSVYQDINSIEECRDLCLNSPYRCHSYDYNDTGEMVCRLSHHARSTLTDVLEPYLDVPEAATYELSSCYNVSIECRSGEMITKIRTSKLFDGKVYAKGAPKSCSVNVNNSLEFDFRMGYNDLECNVRQSANGRYMNDIVIQHHDMIVTSSDLGLAVSCQYDLTNKTVSNEVDLGVTGEIESSLSEEIIIDSPNVIMKITSRDGSDMKRIAEVGDPLSLRFEIVDPQSPYEIFVRELVALDGTDNAEITLIDASGCPTDQYIMGAVQKYSENRKVLISQFDAFKFPSSEVVQFRALVTPCIPHCQPIKCNNEDSVSGELKSLISYGRRRRRSLLEETGKDSMVSSFLHERQRRDVSQKPANDNILLVQSIQITDKFGFNHDEGNSMNYTENTEKVYTATNDDVLACLNGYGLIIAGAVFLLAQLTVIVIWNTVQKRTKKERYLYGHDTPPASINYAGASPLPYRQNHHLNHQQQQHHNSHHQQQRNHNQNNVNDTLGKLYDSGMTGRYGQQQPQQQY